MIPLSIPHLNGNELKYVTDCLETGWVSSAGSYVTKFEKMVAEFSGCVYGVATVNGTSALHLALHMIGVSKGDYVIVPNITFVASANSVLYTNAEPIFFDVDANTWQLNLDLLESWLVNDTFQKNNRCYFQPDGKPKAQRVAAIMPVHVLGNMCNMPRLVEIAGKHNIPIIEDASESLGSYWNGRHSGTWGTMSVFSFNGNKIITTGGGGVIVTNSSKHAKKAKHLSTQSKADPETYFHDEMGFNYRLVNVLAAIGVAQMEQLSSFIKRKKEIDNYYRKELFDIGDISFQEIPKEVESNCWLFTFYSRKKNEILDILKNSNVVARPFWTPMNQLPMFERNIYINRTDNSKEIHNYCLSIPSSTQLKRKEQDEVISLIKSIFE